MDKKYLLIISSILIICSYSIWYYQEKNEHINEKNTILSTKHQINLKKTKEKLEIENSNSNIDIYLNWEEISSWTYVINN